MIERDTTIEVDSYLRNKSDIFKAFFQYKIKVERTARHKMKVLRADNAKKYLSHEFTNYLKKKEITK